MYIKQVITIYFCKVSYKKQFDYSLAVVVYSSVVIGSVVAGEVAVAMHSPQHFPGKGLNSSPAWQGVHSITFFLI